MTDELAKAQAELEAARKAQLEAEARLAELQASAERAETDAPPPAADDERPEDVPPVAESFE
ncbi:MAG TPA: hypothetical protein VFM87_08300, partial [Agrococcus sp.]|nr:hypothetical protein [Agrococcus sp.]